MPLRLNSTRRVPVLYSNYNTDIYFFLFVFFLSCLPVRHRWVLQRVPCGALNCGVCLQVGFPFREAFGSVSRS